MLDHGVDVLWCSFGAMSLAAGAQIGSNFWLFGIVFLGVMVPFFIVTWESYHTHQMVLGYINGPTEGLILVTLVFTFLACTGSAGEVLMSSLAAPVRPSFCRSLHQRFMIWLFPPPLFISPVD